MTEAQVKRSLQALSKTASLYKKTPDDNRKLANAIEDLISDIKIPYVGYVSRIFLTNLLSKKLHPALTDRALQEYFILVNNLKRPRRPAVAPEKRSSMKPQKRKRR
jgi:hypothetical protein